MDLNREQCFDNTTMDLSTTLDAKLGKLCTNFRKKTPTSLDKAGLALHSFCAFRSSSESCGSNGLPLTPKSVQILGKFNSLSQLDHNNLCNYVEICRIQHGKYIELLSQQVSCHFYLFFSCIIQRGLL